MKKFIFTFLFIIFIGTLANAAPSSAPYSNTPVPITQLAYHQSKDAGLDVKKFLVGDFKHDFTKGGANFVLFYPDGKLGIKQAISSSYGVDNWASFSLTDTLEIGSGKVRLSEISTANVPVCADSKGTLVKCLVSIFSHSGDDTKPYETYTYKVPAGVTKITVELYGAGGAGYFQSSSAYDRSPDNYSSCAKTSGGVYHCGSGGSAFLYDVNGTTVIAQAKGGQVATGAHTGGNGGGTYINSSSSKIISSSVNNGSNGGSGANGQNYSTNTLTCVSNYTVRIGGNGGMGGTGGASGNGSATAGGDGGKGGSSLIDIPKEACEGIKSNNDGKGYLSEGGINGQFGAGGSGAGGIGGFSDKGGDLTDTSGDALCTYSSANCLSSDQGYAGGGGGGYTKVQIDVKGGETYTIKLSHGGTVQGMTENKGSVWCYYINKYTCGGGSYSGNGSGAYAKINVN